MSPLSTVLTMGEPAGIGGEITLAAWRDRQDAKLLPFLVIDDPGRLERLAARLGWQVPVRIVASCEEAAAVFDTSLPVLPLSLAVDVAPGQPDSRNCVGVLESINRAVALASEGQISALVTNPIHKAVMHEGGFPHAGHTEYLAELAARPCRPVMMLSCPELRVVPVTVHVALVDAIASLSAAAIVETAEIVLRALREDFAVENPSLAVAGLNPHAGENGLLGEEERQVIAPAVVQLQQAGHRVVGPLPADSLFHQQAREIYDTVLCMYHDQALIPLKTINFSQGVNTTLGLPFVRTSPDHGTAFDIAGSGTADAASLVAAIRLADVMARNRSMAQSRAVA